MKMADGKWIDDLCGDVPLTKAAHHVLKVRLEVVLERLPDALYRSDDDIEHVHQLRVSTRRAGAAVRIFEQQLPGKIGKTLKKRLRKVRRTAGEARDWDVFQETLVQRLRRPTAGHAAGLDFLLGYSQGQRTLAQGHLRELEKVAAEFPALVSQALAGIEEDPAGGTFRSWAVPLMTTLLRDFEVAAAQDLEDYEKLHRVRILGKQLRYAMEVFATCFQYDFRDKIYPAVEEMQDILGYANDSFTAAKRLTDIGSRLAKTQPQAWSRCRKGLEALAKYHERRLPQQRRLFVEWWEKWRASGMEKQFEQMLRE
jgi:CHAD domain-containing protein